VKASARTLEVFLSHRWKVNVVHVYRPYERAVRGVLDRAAKEVCNSFDSEKS
jgi:hypothetical protein